MIKLRFYFIICFWANLLFSQVYSSSPDVLMVFKTIDYESYVGSLISEGIDSTKIKTYTGEKITFHNSEILHAYPFTGRIKNRKIQKRDPNSSFYIFSPSAFPIDKGNLFCRDFCLFFPSVNYGLANIVSAQAGIFWYPGLDFDEIPYVGNLKITILETNLLSIAGGFTYIKLPEIQKERILSTGFGFITGTMGNRYNHFSITAGWGYIQKEPDWDLDDKPIIVAAGNLRLFSTVSLISENWFFPDEDLEDSILTTVLRIFGRQIAVDLGLAFSVSSNKENIAPIPIANVTYLLR